MFAVVTNQSFDNQAPDKTSCSVKVIFAWRINDYILNLHTWSLTLSISKCTMSSIHRLGLFS